MPVSVSVTPAHARHEVRGEAHVSRRFGKGAGRCTTPTLCLPYSYAGVPNASTVPLNLNCTCDLHAVCPGAALCAPWARTPWWPGRQWWVRPLGRHCVLRGRERRGGRGASGGCGPWGGTVCSVGAVAVAGNASARGGWMTPEARAAVCPGESSESARAGLECSLPVNVPPPPSLRCQRCGTSLLNREV